MRTITGTLVECYKYAPESVPREELLDALEELEAWRGFGYETPEELASSVDRLEKNQCHETHNDYDDLKSFFEDCVGALNGHWPGASAHDQTLRQVICDAIANGGNNA